MSNSGGVCWWCCMRVLEKCLPRNDIVRELAPYLQHVHRDDTVDEEGRVLAGRSGSRVRSPHDFEFVAYEDQPTARLSDSQGLQPMLNPTESIDHPPDAVDEIVAQTMGGLPTPVGVAGDTVASRFAANLAPPVKGKQDGNEFNIPTPRQQLWSPHHNQSMSNPSTPLSSAHSAVGHHDIGTGRSTQASTSETHSSHEGSIPKKSSLPKVKTELGDIAPVRWDKVVIVQVSVQGFREMMTQAKDLMEEAKLLYEHTVLSRLATEYSGEEILSHPRSGLFVIAFASEFHAAKWCLSLQLSLLYAAWNDKLLKQFDDMKEEYLPGTGRGRKNHLLYRGFRVRMVIHAADQDIAPEMALAEAVKWTNTVTEFAHGGQIVLSESVWDRLKEQLVQLGNPVVEDLGCHMVLKDEVMLMLLLPRDLECRRFPTLKSPHQLSPGMRDAPSAQKPLTMVFTFIEGARPLVRSHAEELAERIKKLCKIARELLRRHNGYECQELQGDFMLAFFSPVCAVLWCSEFQLRIQQKFREWNRESENQELMFSMSMGIEVGVPASVSPHKTSGRADYFGNIVNQTARIAKAAHGGQILLGGDAWNAFTASPHRSTVIKDNDSLNAVSGSTVVMFKPHGYYSFKGISLPIALVEAVPVDSSIARDAAVRLGLLAQTRAPKAKLADDAQMQALKKAFISPVPSEMLRLQHGTEREQDTIRETELGMGVSWDDSMPMSDDVYGDDDVGSPGHLALMLNSRLNHSNLLQAFRSSSSFNGVSFSPKAARSEKMDRI
ncbi:hypothetical protein Poli38472_002928 [Pythium oligandrum]|uniref:Guanylate cyclase domain-containing protein n=1 Tax=Pythium oligandrum TaxID=41045 RepID=A0A8K1C5W7_PYTOL|nr:hypothetical protein Poli38472_002928 [Pythium oligandrum]|eukprot:TMW57003.1 hypothetical protein Poli38472_002928 [Pythium oligandrum]